MKYIRIKNSSDRIPVGKIVCVGRNYAEHAMELGNEIPAAPVIFLKPSSSVIYSDEDIVYPSFSIEMHHEVELVLLIGKKVKNAGLTEAGEAIAGYGVGLDMTLRDIQDELKKKGHPWTIAKCFDTSAVLSDFILKNDYSLTLNEEISLSINDENRQREKLKLMLFPPVKLVQYVSSYMTLEEGDLIFTGTPKGVGKVAKGDKLFARVENVAELNCTVI
ncbi:MAG: fumarylacetoacetate hydrolase family protein [Ignavibacteriaceae bacterium]|jgi:5-carboxymethyl-2-hydroxymuconate isomerase